MKYNEYLSKLIISSLILFSASACSTHAAFVAENSHGPTNLEIKGKDIGQLPTTTPIKNTTFGRYNFSVTDDNTKLTGNLPLKVKPNNIVLDILFFAPALFFNIQGACEKYILDMNTDIIQCENKGHRESAKITKTSLNP